MADKRIPDLEEATSINTEDLLLVEQGGISKKSKISTIKNSLINDSGISIRAWAKWKETSTLGVFGLTGYNIKSVVSNKTNRIVTFNTPLPNSNYIVIPNAKVYDTAIDVFGSNYSAEGIAVDNTKCYVNYYVAQTNVSVFNVVIIG